MHARSALHRAVQTIAAGQSQLPRLVLVAHVGRCAAEQHVARGGVSSGKVASLAVQDGVRSSSSWPASFIAKLLQLCTGSRRQNVHRIRHSALA